MAEHANVSYTTLNRPSARMAPHKSNLRYAATSTLVSNPGAPFLVCMCMCMFMFVFLMNTILSARIPVECKEAVF